LEKAWKEIEKTSGLKTMIFRKASW